MNINISVLFVNSIGKKKWGGGEKWILYTALGLKEKGHQVKIATRKNSVLYNKALAFGIQVINISYTTDFSLFSAIRLRKYFKRNQTDVAICSLNRDVRVVGGSCKFLTNRPKVIGRQGVQLINNKWKYRFTYKNFSDGILTNSNSLKNIYDSYQWWDDSFVKVIYNGVKNAQSVQKFDFEKFTKLDTDTKVIISAGRLNKQKGFEYLIESAIESKKNKKNWKYFIAGTGRQYRKLKNLIENNNLSDTVYLIGFQDNINSLFTRADVFVLASLYEGMPNVLLESMINKIPVVSTPVNGAKELITDGETGLFIKPKNAQSIYEKLNYLFENKEVLNNIAIQGQQYVIENFTHSNAVDKVHSYLTEVVLRETDKPSSEFFKKLLKSYYSIVSVKHKNVKAWYYLKNFIRIKTHKQFKSKGLNKILKTANQYDSKYLEERVNYYNRLTDKSELTEGYIHLRDFVYTKEMQTYFFDTWKYTRFFNPNCKIKYEFGDVTHIPKEPAIVKSRPIHENNHNSILLNLNKIRHFAFVKDNLPFARKLNKIVWRGNIWTYQPQRISFLEKHFNNPYCNIGHTNKADIETPWKVEKLTIHEQLKYKFILSIEGNDVATNLKWVMSSNSIAVMPTPKFETWFMEGTLIPDYHYIHIKDDYSDLNEKMEYYINNPDKAEIIRQNANNFVHQFKNRRREDLISVLVLQKYFNKN